MKIIAHSLGALALGALASTLLVLGADATLAQSGGGGMIDRFQMLDDDGDSQISANEATTWHDVVFAAMDADEDNALTREEYMAIQLGRGADPDQRGPRYAQRQAEKDARFTQMDSDGDGVVSKDQFLAGGQNDFSKADADKDGAVTMPEFIAARWM